MRILLTGAGGFLGARFASIAVAEGHYVLGIGRSAKPSRLNLLRKQSKFSYQIMDVAEAETLVSRAKTFQPAVLVHMASVGTSRPDQIPAPELLRSHFNAALSIAVAAQETASAVVWIGCASEYTPSDVPVAETQPTDPISVYGVAKSLAWRAFHRLALGRIRATALRPFYVYGPGDRDDRFTRTVMRAVMGRGPNQLGDPLLVRDAVFVDDVARAVLQATETTRLQPLDLLPVINLGSGRGITQAAFAHAIAQVMKVPSFEPGFGAQTPSDGEPPYMVSRLNVAEHALGWKATTTLEDGLAQVFVDFKQLSPEGSG